MEPSAIYGKTAKGIEEIKSRTYRLAPRSRALLIMVDGRSTGGDVIEKGKASGNAGAYATLEELEANGFIEALDAQAVAARVTTTSAASAAPLDAARRFAIDQLLAMLGPNADEFTAGLEGARDRGALLAQLEKCRGALASFAGAQKAARFWVGVEERLQIARPAAAAPQVAAAAPAAGGVERSLASVRVFAAEQLKALPAPHGPAFVERLASAADRATLVTVLERCRNGFQILVSDEAAERFWAGVEARLP